MARSMFRDSIINQFGRPLTGISVEVFDEGTTTPISDTIFAARTGGVVLANPFVISERGEVRFWLDPPAERVDVRYSGTGLVTETETLDGISPDDFTVAASAATYADRKDSTTAYTLNSVVWDDVDIALDIVLSAKTGDWVEVGLSSVFLSEAVDGYLDVVSLVAGAPVNSWASNAAPVNTHQGVTAWTGISGVLTTFGGSIIRKLVAGDISSGTVTLRLRYRTATATDKILLALADLPLTLWARNHG